jgi:hypothetical protein
MFQTYGAWSRWELRDSTHNLPEWKNPHGSSIPIPIPYLLRAQGNSAEEIDEVMRDLEAAEAANTAFGSR